MTKQGVKGQVAMEFMLMIGLAMVMMAALAGLLFHLSKNYSEDKNINRLTDLGYSLQSEILLASEVEPGYTRIISIPDIIESAEFDISQTDTDLVIKYRDSELLFSIPPVTGSLHKGANTIRKIDADIIQIN